MRRNLPIAIAGVAFLGLAMIPSSAIAETTAAPATIRAAALAPRVPRGATRLGALPSTQSVTIQVVLEPSHAGELDALLEDLYNPESPRFEQWLTPSAYLQAFGPDPAQVESTIAWLHSEGLTDTSVQGFAVRATGAAQTVEQALSVSFSRYRLAGGDDGFVASAAPMVPSTLAGDITAILGLSDTVRFRNHISMPRGRRIAGSARAVPADPNAIAHANPSACINARNYAGGQFWTPDQVGRIYGFTDLFNHGMRGQGTTIGLLELAPSRSADISHFLSCFGLHNKVTVREIDGGAVYDEFGTLEADIDIQTAAVSAPGAAIKSYEAPNDGLGEYDAYARMVHDDVEVISTSWGACEAMLDHDAPGFIGTIHGLFKQAAAQGQSVFAAAGDKGSEDCYDTEDSTPDATLQVDNPADDPFVTAAGGTSLGAPGVEPVWNDCQGETTTVCAENQGGATGGGQSAHFSRPKWQPLATGATCSTCRLLPDLSANAGIPEVFYDADFPPGPGPGPDNWVAVGGTSIAAPRLAGMAADIASGRSGGRVGNFAPKVAALVAKGVYGTALSDITKGFDVSGSTAKFVTPGDNDLTRNHASKFKTAKGFDLASGFGTPIARGLSCPQITSISARRGRAGNRVNLRGLGLERATIKFGSHKAQVLSKTATTATVVVPAGSGAVRVSGSSPMGTGTQRVLFSYPGADTTSYRTVAADGGVFTFGGAKFFGAPVGATTAPIIGMAIDHATGGYWLASSDGNVYNFNAPHFGSTHGMHLNQPIVGIAAMTNGKGYLLVARDGGIFAFGAAQYYGSTGGMHLNKPIVGIAINEHTGGYWLVASDGGIFAFNAPFYGSTGGIHLNRPIVGMVEDARTGGYWLVASDGGVFAFRAPFYGSTGAIHLNQPIVGAVATGDARGYWFVARDGGVFTFGDARFAGSKGGTPLNSPMVAIATAH